MKTMSRRLGRWRKPEICVQAVVLAALALPVFASDQAYDAGLRYFQKRDWRSAVYYFELAHKNAPWDSTTMYYLALSYHHAGFKSKAKSMYVQIVEKYPGTQVRENALVALRSLDPKAAAEANRASARGGSRTTASSGASSSTKAGAPKSEMLPFRRDGQHVIVNVVINGRNVPMHYEPQGGGITLSQRQAASAGLGVSVDAEEGTAQVKGSDITAKVVTAHKVKLGPVEKQNVPVHIVENTAKLQYPQIGQGFCSDWSLTVDDSAGAIHFVRR